MFQEKFIYTKDKLTKLLENKTTISYPLVPHQDEITQAITPIKKLLNSDPKFTFHSNPITPIKRLPHIWPNNDIVLKVKAIQKGIPQIPPIVEFLGSHTIRMLNQHLHNVFNPKGNELQLDKRIKDEKKSQVWAPVLENKVCRLAQWFKGRVKAQNAMEFIQYQEIPKIER